MLSNKKNEKKPSVLQQQNGHLADIIAFFLEVRRFEHEGAPLQQETWFLELVPWGGCWFHGFLQDGMFLAKPT